MTQIAPDAEATASPPKRAGVDYSKFDAIEDSDDEKPSAKHSPAKKANENPHCGNCAKEIVKPLRCGVCKKAEYCSQQCQREDWQFHKRVCKKPEELKPKEDANNRKQDGEKTPARPKGDDKVVIDDEEAEDLTWYRHREWKPSGEPKKDFKPVQLTGDAAAAASAADASKPGAGSAWNTAGTWEDKDVSSTAKAMLRARLEDFPSVEVSGGTLSVSEVEALDGEASKPVVRGVTRHLWDLNLKLKLEFKWMGSEGQLSADGTLSIGDFSQNTSFEAGCDSLKAPVVDVSFTGLSTVDAGRRVAIEDALGAKAWPGGEGTLLAALAERMRQFSEEFAQVP
ncbi:unnamed protein product [Prorocentrum cordatum]|uniref:MYND-type domain-containing protein n=1 Tax=Prorocentrum cordatum TaxID=2364126 RepID=A0ABN9VKY9_9DINO|nr:unnamed protein product [Polarella glacialis]